MRIGKQWNMRTVWKQNNETVGNAKGNVESRNDPIFLKRLHGMLVETVQPEMRESNLLHGAQYECSAKKMDIGHTTHKNPTATQATGSS
jgi:hypothetical protein